MSEVKSETLKAIQDAGLAEFLAKGFQKASLRSIAKNAGVTTGAFYGYYPSKEALLDDIVGPHAVMLMEMYDKAALKFRYMDDQAQDEAVGDIGNECMKEMITYCYDHLPGCKLLFTGAQGTKFENFIHDLVEKEIKETRAFEEALTGRGYEITPMSERFEHIITSGMFAAMVEPVIHEIPFEEAMEDVMMIHEFYTAGWKHITGFGRR